MFIVSLTLLANGCKTLSARHRYRLKEVQQNDSSFSANSTRVE